MHSGAGEWIWRPLRNPPKKTISSFIDNNPRGFGLMQRDRVFENYQDLEAYYHQRPGYWVEPIGQWGEGRVELVEIPTPDETHDNVVAYWEPSRPYEPGQEVTVSYRLRAAVRDRRDAPGRQGGEHLPDAAPRQRLERARAIRPFAASSSTSPAATWPITSRDPAQVQLVPSISAGKITHTFLMPNEHTDGFRAAIDVKLEPGQSTDLRAFLKAGNRTLTETWTYPWSVE